MYITLALKVWVKLAAGHAVLAGIDAFGKAINDAFARWDHNHLHEFTLADGALITPAHRWDGEEPEGSLDGAKARLGRLRPASSSPTPST